MNVLAEGVETLAEFNYLKVLVVIITKASILEPRYPLMSLPSY